MEKVDTQVSIISFDRLCNILDGGNVKRDRHSKKRQNNRLKSLIWNAFKRTKPRENAVQILNSKNLQLRAHYLRRSWVLQLPFPLEYGLDFCTPDSIDELFLHPFHLSVVPGVVWQLRLVQPPILSAVLFVFPPRCVLAMNWNRSEILSSALSWLN